MKKLYFILGLSFLTSTMSAQWQELDLPREDIASFDVSPFEAPNFVALTEDDNVFSLYYSLVPVANDDTQFLNKFKIYSGSTFTSLSLPPALSYGQYDEDDFLTSNNNEPYFAFRNSSAKLSVVKFSGTNWQNVGSTNISQQNADEINIGFTPDNKPFVIYRGFDAGFKLYVKQYVAPDWLNVGSPYTPIATPSTPYVAIANDGTPYIAFQDNGLGNYVLVKKFNTTTSNWDDVSSSTLSSGITQLGGLTIINDMPYLAFRDEGSGFHVQVKRFNGANWELVGNTVVSTSGDNEIIMRKTASDVIYVAYRKSGKVTVKRLVGNEWVVVGNEDITLPFFGDYDFDVNDNNNCVLIYKAEDEDNFGNVLDFTPILLKFDGSTLSKGSIETGKIFNIVAFPNPVTNTLNIETDLLVKNIVIYNDLGQSVLESKFKTIDTSSLSSGMYFVKIMADEGTSYRSIKIIKK
jgi:hypothetical protein